MSRELDRVGRLELQVAALRRAYRRMQQRAHAAEIRVQACERKLPPLTEERLWIESGLVMAAEAWSRNPSAVNAGRVRELVMMRQAVQDAAGFGAEDELDRTRLRLVVESIGKVGSDEGKS